MAAKKGKHTCACKWWKWIGNSNYYGQRGIPARFKASEARHLQPEERGR